QLGDHGTVVDLVKNIARLARTRETGKAGAARTHAPGRNRDIEASDLGLDGVNGNAAPVEAFTEAVIVVAQIGRTPRIFSLDDGWVDDVFGHGRAPPQNRGSQPPPLIPPHKGEG